jgi:hypothetical protein
MSITNAQFAKLADYYGFDIIEARKILDLLKPKQKRPDGPDGEKKVAKLKKAENPKKAEKPKRGPTGYQMFLKYYHPIAKVKMQSNLASGEKLTNGIVVKHVSSEWKVLSESKRDAWKKKAAAM